MKRTIERRVKIAVKKKERNYSTEVCVLYITCECIHCDKRKCDKLVTKVSRVYPAFHHKIAGMAFRTPATRKWMDGWMK